MTRLPLFAALALVAIAAAPPVASASDADESALAQRYAPVVRLVAYDGSCGSGKPYVPINVNLLFGEPTVALRGPWGGGDLVKIAPTAADLAQGLYEYHLDFPGSTLHPGCDYLRWERRITAGQPSVAYAHVATERGYPGKLALQYWFYYVFNDWNNLHEGDWEMIQLVFDASTPAQALQRAPVEVGYSQHTGAEQAAWGDSKLERVGGTHPVVHPATGSHANFYGEALYLGSSADQGVGCDDTRGPTIDVRPAIETIPSDRFSARAQFPWIAFEGRWGELRPAFFNGPTGPNLKTQWTKPFLWAEGWRTRAFTVPGGSAFGPAATGFFCSTVATGSRGLVRFVDRRFEFSLALAGLALLVIIALSRATWRPAAPFRLARRRAWGQILAATARMYVRRLFLFIGIGIVLVPISLLVTLLQASVLHATNVLGVQTGGESDGLLAFFVLAVGTTLTLLGLGFVQAATIRALVEIDEGRPIGPLRAYRLAGDSLRSLFGGLLIAVVAVSFLATSIFLTPIAVWLAGRWALIVPTAELERRSAIGALRRSGRLVRGRWLKAASLIIAGGAAAVVVGPLVGVLLILATDLPFAFVNVVAGVVYAVTFPIVGITTAYVYFDARVRDELGAEQEPAELPAEIGISTT